MMDKQETVEFADQIAKMLLAEEPVPDIARVVLEKISNIEAQHFAAWCTVIARAGRQDHIRRLTETWEQFERGEITRVQRDSLRAQSYQKFRDASAYDRRLREMNVSLVKDQAFLDKVRDFWRVAQGRGPDKTKSGGHL